MHVCIVYKLQNDHTVCRNWIQLRKNTALSRGDELTFPSRLTAGWSAVKEAVKAVYHNNVRPVSYTHLTLPTTPYV